MRIPQQKLTGSQWGISLNKANNSKRGKEGRRVKIRPNVKTTGTDTRIQDTGYRNTRH